MTMTYRVGTWAMGAVLALAGGIVRTAYAQELPATSPSPAAQAANAGGGTGEGIKVHGHWTIEVRNPDGSLVSRHQFENALVRREQYSANNIGTGDTALALMLVGVDIGPSWEIALADATDSTVRGWFRGGPCDGSFAEAAPGVCIATAAVSLVSGAQVQLKAAITAGPAAGQDGRRVRVVGTRLGGAGTTGGANGIFIFSARELPEPLTIAPGQIVQVTVILSFS